MLEKGGKHEHPHPLVVADPKARPAIATIEVVHGEKGVRLAQKTQVGHAFLWGYSSKRLQLAQLLGQLGVFLAYGALMPGGVVGSQVVYESAWGRWRCASC